MQRKYFIYMEGNHVAVSEEVYYEYHRLARRERYLEERDVEKGLTFYNALDTDEILGEDMIPDTFAESVERSAFQRVFTEKLRDAMEILSEEEKNFLSLIYFSNFGEGVSQREAAKMLGISQPAVKKRHDKIISNLKKFMKV